MAVDCIAYQWKYRHGLLAGVDVGYLLASDPQLGWRQAVSGDTVNGVVIAVDARRCKIQTAGPNPDADLPAIETRASTEYEPPEDA